MKRVTIYTDLSGNKHAYPLQYALIMQAEQGGTVEEIDYTHVDPVEYCEIEVDRNEVTLRFTANEGEETDIYFTEDLKYYFDEGRFYADGSQFSDFPLTKDERKHLDAVVGTFVDDMEVEDFHDNEY